MKKKNIIYLSVVILVLLVGTYIYFLGHKKERTPSLPKEIKVGFVADLTGPLAIYGKWVLNGAQIAVDEVNKNGGINNRPFSLIIEDSQTDPKSAVNAINKLINVDKVKVVISGNGSSSVMAMAPVANQHKVILFITLASSPSITNAGDYVFRNRISGLFEIREMAKLIAEKLNLSQIAVAVLDNEAGHAYIKAFADVFEKSGGKVVKSVLLGHGEVDFRTQVTKIKETSPQGVFYAGPVKEGAHFIRQATEIGLKTKWLSVSPIQSDELFKILGDVADGLIFASEGVDENNPNYLKFKDEYQQRHEELPSIYSVNGYDAVKIIAHLIKSEGHESDKIKTAIYDIKKYRGAGGILEFDSHGDIIKEIKLKIVKSRSFFNYTE